MLADSPVTTMLPVIDMERARDFYENKLGLKPIGLKPKHGRSKWKPMADLRSRPQRSGNVSMANSAG